MRVPSLSLGLLLVFVLSFCNAEMEIAGVAECADCKLNNFNPSHAFSGLHVTINCKLKEGIKRIADGDVDEAGKFKIPLPEEIAKRVMNLKKECYAQLHSAAAAPCPSHGGVDAAKIAFKSQTGKNVVFAPAEALRFSTALCTSKLLWPYFGYPPLPKMDPWKKDWPKITFPPLESFGNPWSLPPTYESKPKPEHKFKPPVPAYKPKEKPPVFKALPPPAPMYKPPTKPIPPPFYKPTPKTPVYNKPLPPTVPVYRPLPPTKPVYKPPVYKPLPPTKPVYKPPVYKPLPPTTKPLYKPLPPAYKPPVVTEPLAPEFPMFPLPPLLKKPCPPFAKIPPKNFDGFPKLPPFDGSNP